MRESLGNRPASHISTREINAMLARQAATGVAPRTVNKSRQLVCAIYNYACQEATFGLPGNPASAADSRPEPERARLDFYSPEEVEALARALGAGMAVLSAGLSTVTAMWVLLGGDGG